ncbi:MAG: sugar phosphate isomerase/epimerase family protein [Chitinophagaceae bacterium]
MSKISFSSCSLLIFIFLNAACNSQVSNESATVEPETKKTDWNIGVALYSFNLFPFSVALNKADSTGVKFVEGFSFHALKGEFNDSTMGQISIHGILRMKQMLEDKGMKMKSMYVSEAKDVNEWKSYFEKAKTLGIEFLVCEPDKNHWDMIDSLGEMYNIKIAIHEHASSSSIYWHPDSVLAAIKGHKNIGACADLGHWARSGLDPAKCLNQLKGHILGIHLKDIAQFNNTEAEDVIVGKGVINFAEVVRELKDQNYRGFIYMECEHKMSDNVPDVIESIKYFNSLSEKGDKKP